MENQRTAENSIKIIKVFPDFCKYHSCFNQALYEFIYKKTIIGHSCMNHVEDVNKMLTNIYYKKKEK